MNQKSILAYVCVCLAMCMFMPFALSAADVGKESLMSLAEQLSQFLYNAPIMAICSVAGVVCIYHAFQSSSVTPLGIWVLIVVFANMVPKIVKAIIS